MSSDRRIVVFYAWGTQNAGDHALTVGALNLLSSLLPQQQITVVSRFAKGESPHDATDELKRQFPGISVVPCPFGSARATRFQRLLQNTEGLAVSLVCMVLPRLALRLFRGKQAIQELGRADLVLLTGGNLFYWHRYRKSLPRLGAFAWPLVMAHRLGITYGFLPQTSGPFEGRVGQCLGMLFERARFAFFRDRASVENVAAVADLTKTKVALVPDLAFFLRPGTPQQQGEVLSSFRLASHEYVAVTVRVAPLGDRGLAQEEDDTTEALSRLARLLPEALASAANQLHRRLVFVVQADEDVEPTREMQRLLADRYHVHSQLIDTRDVPTLMAIYANAFLLLGMRMHSLIFALKQGTPVVALWRKELGTKIPSMLSDMGLQDYALDLGAANADALLDAIRNVALHRHALSERVTRYLEQQTALETELLRPYLVTGVGQTGARDSL